VLYELLYPLTPYFSPFNLFQYITFRGAFAGLTSLVLVLLFMPLFIKKVPLRERISEDVPRNHMAKGGTPSSGGIVMVTAVVLASLLWAKLSSLVGIALFTTVYMGLMGLWDDIAKRRGKKKKGMSKTAKLICQFALSVGVIFGLLWVFPDHAFSIQLPFVKNILLNISYFYVIFAMLIFVGTTNAVNLTDGLDGLAAGAALPVFAAMGIIAYAAGNAKISEYLSILHVPGAGELTIIAAALLGALLGFLWFNAHPAEVFMGDTGSQALGGALGIIAMLTKHEIVLLIAAGLFMAEALSVMMQVAYFKATHGKRIFLCSPLHHHYEKKGWPENRIVVRFWIVSVMFCILAIATLKIR